MKATYFIRRHIAVGQRTPADTSPYGRGFNYQVEIGLEWPTDFHAVESETQLVLAEIDHKALGVDMQMAESPSTEFLCRWLYQQLHNREIGVRVVRLIRGDGLQAISRSLDY